MVTYYVYIHRHATRRVLDLPGLTQITLSTLPDFGAVSVLRFETAPGCEPCGAEFLYEEITRMGAEVLGWTVDNESAPVA